MTKKMQRFGSFICTQSALHVSGDVFAHRQEHLTVFTASDIVHLCCCRPVSWTRWNEFHLVHNTSRQKHRWILSEAVNTVKYFWWWAITSPETCRADWVQINKPKRCILLVINYEFLEYTSEIHFTQNALYIADVPMKRNLKDTLQEVKCELLRRLCEEIAWWYLKNIEV